MKSLSILSLLVLIAIAWGCEKSPTEDVTSSDEEGPCPAQADSVAFTAAPELLSFVTPPFPDSSVHAGHSGIVGVNVLVGRQGGVQDVVVRKSSGFAELDALVRDYAYKNMYQPGRNRFSSICMWMPYIVEFDPTESDPNKQVVLVN